MNIFKLTLMLSLCVVGNSQAWSPLLRTAFNPHRTIMLQLPLKVAAQRAMSSQWKQHFSNNFSKIKELALNVSGVASRTAGSFTFNKVKEDPYAAAHAAVGGTTGFVLSGEGVVKTSTGTLVGACAGWQLGKNKRDLEWLRKNAATREDLSSAVTTLGSKIKTGSAEVVQSLKGLMNQQYRNLRESIKSSEQIVVKDIKELGSKMDRVIENQKTSSEKIGDLWTKWFKT